MKHPIQGLLATGLIGPIYGPDGSVLFDPSDQATSQLNANTWGQAPNDIVAANITGYATTAGSFVSTGFGVSLTASVTGRILVRALGQAQNTSAGDTADVAVYRNTSGVPSGGTSVGTDTQIQSQQTTSAAASQWEAFAIEKLDTGLVSGTTYYYYLALYPAGGEGQAGVRAGSQIIAQSR